MSCRLHAGKRYLHFFFWLLHQPALCALERREHQHRNCHWTNAAGHRSDFVHDVNRLIVAHVTHEPVPALLRSVLHPSDGAHNPI